MTFLEVFILVATLLVNTLLMGFVYMRNPRSATHRLLSLLIIIINCYLVANYLAFNNYDLERGKWLIRSVMFFAAPMSVCFLLLMRTFPHASLSVSRRYLWFWFIVTTITMAVALSPYLFPRVQLSATGVVTPVPGPGLLLFIPIGVGTIPLGLFYLIRKMRRTHGIERTQMQFLLLGVTLMFSLIIALIFIGTVVFGSSIFARYAPLFTLPFVFATTYAIVRYRLMDIRLAIFRGLSLTFLVGSVLLVYILIIVGAVPVVSRLTGISSELLAAVAALISIPIARLVQQGLSKLTDRFLFQDRVDYRKALVQIGQDLSGTIQIEEVTDVVLRAIVDGLRSAKIVIMLKDEQTREFIPRGKRWAREFTLTIPHKHPILEHLRHSQSTLVKDELVMFKEHTEDPAHLQEIATIEHALAWLDVSVVIPLFVNRDLTGVMLLGEKLSGQPYLQDDVEFLNALAPQAATSLENARLYKQSLEFGQRLRAEVESATSELEVANRQLKELDKAKSEFLSIASHQLYTPLTALRGYISMLVEGDFGTLSEQQAPILGILDKSTTRLIELIKNLLDISRIESGRLELNLQSVNVVRMAQELVADLLPNALNKQLQLLFEQPEAPESFPHVVADEQRVRQVMLNFIDNAIKYTQRGWVKVRLVRQGDEVVFVVTDSGKGLSHDEISRLFNKFTRVGGAARFHTEGTGLGLYVAKQIVREHRGEVSVDSSGTNAGSTFSMHLPIEGSPLSLKLGDKASVVIKAAEA